MNEPHFAFSSVRTTTALVVIIFLGIVMPSRVLAQTFNDVPTDYWAYSFIETLVGNGITAGCGNDNYCPADVVTRAQMAVFLERGIHGSDFVPSAATGTIFQDVGAGDFAASFIEQLFAEGITAGCGNGNYCPESVVSRAQMAVFLLRAKYGAGYSPPLANGVFNDVPLSYWAVHWIEQLAAEGITAGCGNGNYCPDSPVNRDQMAVFLVRTFDLESVPSGCQKMAGGGSKIVAKPQLLATLFDRWHEAWLGSPAVADIDADGEAEILVPRFGLLLGWHLDNQIVFNVEVDQGRIYSSPVVADLVPEIAGLEVAVAADDKIYVYDASGTVLSGFPYQWQQELRSLAAEDIDGDGRLELVAAATNYLSVGGQRDNMIAVNDDGSVVAGFPPNTSGSSGCDNACYVAGAYGQNISLGDIDGDGQADLVVSHDNAYMSAHEGNGRAFDAADIFDLATKFSGIRFLHDYSEAQMGWALNEDTANQTSFTRSAPVIADIDGNGSNEIVVLGSVQNAALNDRERGVALWVVNNDGTRPNAWTTPFHASDYLAGLYDFGGTNIVGASNDVSVADITTSSDGLEMVFAGFDGQIHAVDANANELWSTAYTASDRVLTSGVVIADLSGDGSPEVVFNTYSPDNDVSSLFVYDANGIELHSIPLSGRGAMPVPTIADVNGDSQLEIVVSLKDGTTGVSQVLVYTVPGSSDNCLPWPTGRGNYLRSGLVEPN